MAFTQEDMPGIRKELHRALQSLREHVGEKPAPYLLRYSNLWHAQVPTKATTQCTV